MRGGTVSSCLAQPQSLMHNWAWWIIDVQWLLFGQWMLRCSLLYTIDVEESRYLPPATRHEEYGHITCHQPKAPGSASMEKNNGASILEWWEWQQYPISRYSSDKSALWKEEGWGQVGTQEDCDELAWVQSGYPLFPCSYPCFPPPFHSSQGCYELPRILTINDLCRAVS